MCRNVVSLNCKQKFCVFSKDKNSNKESIDLRISQKIAQSDLQKDKINPQITICRLLIQTLLPLEMYHSKHKRENLLKNNNYLNMLD